MGTQTMLVFEMDAVLSRVVIAGCLANPVLTALGAAAAGGLGAAAAVVGTTIAMVVGVSLWLSTGAFRSGDFRKQHARHDPPPRGPPVRAMASFHGRTERRPDFQNRRRAGCRDRAGRVAGMRRSGICSWRHEDSGRRTLAAYGGKYALFLALALGLSLFALRLPFYPPPEIPAIKQPVWLSLSRTFELTLAIYFMLASARAFRGNPVLFRLALDLYAGIGVLSAAGSLLAWALLKTTGASSFLVYGFDDRVRGLFNEGGPFGMFLVSVAMALLLRGHLFSPKHPMLHKASLAILLAGLFASGSKAGLLAAVALCLVAAAASGSRVRRIALAGGCALILIVSAALFQGKLFGYFYAYLNFDEALAYRPDDPSLIMGRIAAAIVVPRMVEAHPLLGIGVGNYSLMRNDPDYLEGLPPVDDWICPAWGSPGRLPSWEFRSPCSFWLFCSNRCCGPGNAVLRPWCWLRLRSSRSRFWWASI